MMDRTKIRRVLELIGIVSAIYFLSMVASDAARELSKDRPSFNWGVAATSTAALVVVYVGLAALWAVVARELGEYVPVSKSIQLWSLANIARYIPGKIWQVAGLVSAAAELRVSAGLALTVAIIGLVAMTGTGMLVGIVLAPEALKGASSVRWIAWITASGLLIPIFWPRFLPWILSKFGRVVGDPVVRSATRLGMLRITSWFVLVWIVLGSSFYWFASSMGRVNLGEWGAYVGCYGLAYAFGLLIVFVPGGIGVRESALSQFLTSSELVGVPPHSLAIASRVWSIVAEFLLLVGVLVTRTALRPPLTKRDGSTVQSVSPDQESGRETSKKPEGI